jgi:peptide/nickel transport system permease protein
MIRLNTNLQFSIILCLLPLIMATVSYFWQPFDVTELNISNRLKPMSLTHPLGTDHFGRDMLSMIMVGARTSIAVAFVAVGIGVLFGVPLGLFAATWRGSFIDDSVMRFNDLIFAFPSLVIAILITAIAGPSAFNAIIAIGVFNIPVFARVSRGAALSLWQREFILSARVAGKTGLRISIEHILPNLMHILIVQATIQFSLGILAEAGLSYVGDWQ